MIMQIIWTYPAVFEQLDGEVVVRFPDVPGCITGAETMEEARELAPDALGEVILHFLAHGHPVPAPRRAAKGEEAVVLDPLTAGRAAVASIMAERNVSEAALATLMRRDEKVVRRIVGGARGVTMDNVTAALEALGARPALEVEVI